MNVDEHVKQSANLSTFDLVHIQDVIGTTEGIESSCKSQYQCVLCENTGVIPGFS